MLLFRLAHQNPTPYTRQDFPARSYGLSQPASRAPLFSGAIPHARRQQPATLANPRVGPVEAIGGYCGGSVSLIASPEDPTVIIKILAHLRLPTKVPFRTSAWAGGLFRTVLAYMTSPLCSNSCLYSSSRKLLAEKPLHRQPTVEIHAYTAVLVTGRAMGLGGIEKLRNNE